MGLQVAWPKIPSTETLPCDNCISSMEEQTQVSAAALLDTWAAHPWDNGLQLDSLDEMDRLVVWTQNSRYEITVISPRAHEILVRGGRFFAEFTAARLSGSSLGGSFLKLGGIYVDFSMEMNANGQVVITSRVRTIEVHRTRDREVIREISGPPLES
jgi:hypothetical protein